MKMHLTKIVATLSLLGCITSANALDENNRWHFTLGLDYMQFSNNGSTYAQTTTGTNYNINPSYQPGYNLGIGYRLPGKNTDINLYYTHLNIRDTSSIAAPGLSLSGGATSLGPATWVSGTNKLTYDSLDFTGGHDLNITPRFRMNYYGGLNYSRLDRDMVMNGTGAGNRFINRVGTSFTGIGPTFGMDGDCYPFDNIYPRFNVFGGMKGSLLYGTMSGYVNSFNNDIATRDIIPNDKIVAPVINAKLGIGFQLPVKGFTLNTQLGYSLTEYFGATRDSSYNNTSNNASFQGLFLNVTSSF